MLYMRFGDPNDCKPSGKPFFPSRRNLLFPSRPSAITTRETHELWNRTGPGRPAGRGRVSRFPLFFKTDSVLVVVLSKKKVPWMMKTALKIIQILFWTNFKFCMIFYYLAQHTAALFLSFFKDNLPPARDAAWLSSLPSRPSCTAKAASLSWASWSAQSWVKMHIRIRDRNVSSFSRSVGTGILRARHSAKIQT